MDKSKLIKIGLIAGGAYILFKMTQSQPVYAAPSSGGSNWLTGLIDLTRDIVNKTGSSGSSVTMSKYSVRGVRIPSCSSSDVMAKIASISDQNSQTMSNPTLMRPSSLISGYANQADSAGCKATGSALRTAAASLVK